MIPDTLPDRGFACGPFAVIEVGLIPVLHFGRQSDVAETPGGIRFQLVLFFRGVDRLKSPRAFFGQRPANRLPVILPFPVAVDCSISFQLMCRIDDTVILPPLRFGGGNVMIPEGSSRDSNHIAFEFRQIGRSRHGPAECFIFTFSADPEDADHKWHLRG